MTKQVARNGIISDADVLIDYALSAPQVLRQVSDHIQQLYVALPVFTEVDQLSIKDAQKLGLEIVEPTLSQIEEAAVIRREKLTLSGQDVICFVMAKENRWFCLTNDKALRSYCRSSQVSCLWGLEVMIQLVSYKKLTSEQACTIAHEIQSKNKYIKDDIVTRFKKKLSSL